MASLRTAAQLAQAGEFGLVLIELARQLKLISGSAFQITLSAMLLSMFIAPFLIARAARASGDLGRGDWAHKATVIHDIAVHSIDLGEHVVICGYGRTGGRIAEFLAIESIPFIALDVDPQRIADARAEGINVVFGNADRREVLQAAGMPARAPWWSPIPTCIRRNAWCASCARPGPTFRSWCAPPTTRTSPASRPPAPPR
jgi:CPA2 family monovalent cation:H+ antiporter-2